MDVLTAGAVPTGGAGASPAAEAEEETWLKGWNLALGGSPPCMAGTTTTGCTAARATIL